MTLIIQYKRQAYVVIWHAVQETTFITRNSLYSTPRTFRYTCILETMYSSVRHALCLLIRRPLYPLSTDIFPLPTY